MEKTYQLFLERMSQVHALLDDLVTTCPLNGPAHRLANNALKIFNEAVEDFLTHNIEEASKLLLEHIDDFEPEFIGKIQDRIAQTLENSNALMEYLRSKNVELFNEVKQYITDRPSQLH